MVEYVERYLNDDRLQSAYLGQGVSGTFASPHVGTAGQAILNFWTLLSLSGGTMPWSSKMLSTTSLADAGRPHSQGE